MTKSQAIVEELMARVSQITIANGFETDAGLAVYLGETPALGPDDADQAIAIVMGDQDVTFNREHVRYDWPIDIQALAKADLDSPWITIMQIAGDIKRAVELADRTLGGLVTPWFVRQTVRTLPREAGSTTVGATVRYVFPVNEIWGTP